MDLTLLSSSIKVLEISLYIYVCHLQHSRFKAESVHAMRELAEIVNSATITANDNYVDKVSLSLTANDDYVDKVSLSLTTSTTSPWVRCRCH